MVDPWRLRVCFVVSDRVKGGKVVLSGRRDPVRDPYPRAYDTCGEPDEYCSLNSFENLAICCCNSRSRFAARRRVV